MVLGLALLLGDGGRRTNEEAPQQLSQAPGLDVPSAPSTVCGVW
jgi:hypothetical protein